MMKVYNEQFGKPRLGWVVDREVAFDSEAIDIRVGGERLPAATVEYIIRYGLRQAVNDAAAGTASREETVAAVEGKLAALLSGEPVRKGGGMGRVYSPEDVEVINVLKSALTKRGLKAKEALQLAKTAVLEGAAEVEGISLEKAREVARARLKAMEELGL